MKPYPARPTGNEGNVIEAEISGVARFRACIVQRGVSRGNQLSIFVCSWILAPTLSLSLLERLEKFNGTRRAARQFPSSAAKRTPDSMHGSSASEFIWSRSKNTRATRRTHTHTYTHTHGNEERTKGEDGRRERQRPRRCEDADTFFTKRFSFRGALLEERERDDARERAGRKLGQGAGHGTEKRGWEEKKASLNISWNKEKCDSAEARPQHFCLYKIMYSAGLRHISQSITSSLCVSLALPLPPALRPTATISSFFALLRREPPRDTTTVLLSSSAARLLFLPSPSPSSPSSDPPLPVSRPAVCPSAHTPTSRRVFPQISARPSFSSDVPAVCNNARTNASRGYRNRISCGRGEELDRGIVCRSARSRTAILSDLIFSLPSSTWLLIPIGCPVRYWIRKRHRRHRRDSKVLEFPPSRSGVSNLFLQRASYKFENVVRAAYKKLIQTLNDELKLSLY